MRKQLKLLSSIQSQTLKKIPQEQKLAIIDIGTHITSVLKKQSLVHTKHDLWQFTSEFCGASGKALEEYFVKLKDRQDKNSAKTNKYRIKPDVAEKIEDTKEVKKHDKKQLDKIPSDRKHSDKRKDDRKHIEKKSERSDRSKSSERRHSDSKHSDSKYSESKYNEKVQKSRKSSKDSSTDAKTVVNVEKKNKQISIGVSKDTTTIKIKHGNNRDPRKKELKRDRERERDRDRTSSERSDQKRSKR